MNLGIVDIVIIILLAGSIYKGIKNGLIKEALSFLSYFVSAFLANQFKGYFALFFLDFVKLPPEFSSLESVRMMIASTIAFLVLWFVFNIILKVIINIVASIEKATISGITMYFAAALSFLKTYLVIFVVLFGLSFVGNDFVKDVNESTSAKVILYNTPLLSDFVNGTGSELKDVIANINEMIANGETLDLSNINIVSDFIKDNPNLLSNVISSDMVREMLGDNVSIADLNQMVSSGDVDPEVIKSIINEDVINMVLESDSLDLDQLKALYDSGTLDSELIKTFATPDVVQVLLDQQIFTKEELQTMYDNGEIEGEDIRKILEGN